MGQDGGLCKAHPNLGEVWIQALMANQSKGGASAAKRPRALTGQALRRRLIQTSPAHAVRTSSRAKVRRVW